MSLVKSSMLIQSVGFFNYVTRNIMSASYRKDMRGIKCE